MAHFIGHHPCPRCGSSDAYGEYSDGSWWCFSCKLYKPAKNTLQSVTNLNVTKVTKELQGLPNDCVSEITGEPLLWLRKYHLTNENIFENNILWSASHGLLIFPYFGDGNLLCWQGRYFPQRKPKNHTEGKPEEHLLLHYCNTVENYVNFLDSSVCVVEDTVSGIKVSSIMDSCVLWGSNLSNQKARKLSKLYDHLVLWLDGDKTADMIKFQNRYGWMFKSVRVISTECDPKEHTTEQIKEILNAENSN